MQDSASAAGTNQRSIRTWRYASFAAAAGTVLFLGLAASFFPSCANFSLSKSSPAGLDSQDDDDDDADEEPADGDAQEGGELTALPRPAKATAWHTRVFVTTTPQPSTQALSTCHEQLAAINETAANQSAMLQAQAQASSLVASDLKLYHYCFFELMMRLDDRLELGGPVMDDLANVFFKSMRQLWILARALDAQNGKNDYFTWLQRRYIEISSSHFGRHLEVVAPPMQRLQGGTVLTGPDQSSAVPNSFLVPQLEGKPAGSGKTK